MPSMHFFLLFSNHSAYRFQLLFGWHSFRGSKHLTQLACTNHLIQGEFIKVSLLCPLMLLRY
nr:MAG TPA: hypothetical protein [Caudoviricetes sp.]